jgi:predicted transcriptional regulator
MQPLELLEQVEHLRDIIRPGSRAPTQRAVLISLLRGHSTPEEIAKDLGLSLNAVNIALHQLSHRGLVRRVRRGIYEAEMEMLLLAMLSLIEEIRSRVVQRRRGPMDSARRVRDG